MKTYVTPEVGVYRLYAEDVIMSSGGQPFAEDWLTEAGEEQGLW